MKIHITHLDENNTTLSYFHLIQLKQHQIKCIYKRISTCHVSRMVSANLFFLTCKWGAFKRRCNITDNDDTLCDVSVNEQIWALTEKHTEVLPRIDQNQDNQNAIMLSTCQKTAAEFNYCTVIKMRAHRGESACWRLIIFLCALLKSLLNHRAFAN